MRRGWLRRSSDRARDFVGLFLVQRRGTGFIGAICGPIMLAWFIVIGILGLRGVVLAPWNSGCVQSVLRPQLWHPSASAGRSLRF